MARQLSEKLIERYLDEDLLSVGCPSDCEVDEDVEDIRPPSPLNNFDVIFNDEIEKASGYEEDEREERSLTTEAHSSEGEKDDDIATVVDVNQPSTSSGIIQSVSQRREREPRRKTKKGGTTQNRGIPQGDLSTTDVPNRVWRKRETTTEIPEIQQDEDCLHSVSSSCLTATDIFLKLIEPIVEIIVFQTNLYATQLGKNLKMTREEFLTFIGINFVMGYHKLPSKHDYWNQSEDLGVPVVSKAMSRDRFDELLSNLHCNDNHMMPKDCKDRLYKLRPIVDLLNKSFYESYNGTRELSVDESIVLFKGRSVMKQYNPMKPINRGYKVWCIADMKGYIFTVDVYQGKNEALQQEFCGYGLGERVVLNLTKKFWGTKRIVFFDNYFSSLPLLEMLKVKDVLACGTIRQNRKGLPENMTPDSKLNRGDYYYRISDMGVSFFKWRDNRPIGFISNYHGTEQSEVKRTQKDGSRKIIPCPKVVKDYNQFMGGVDLADRYRVLYGVNRKSNKWWHRIFFALLDITFVNAFVVYCEMFGKNPVLTVRRQIAQGLIAAKEVKKGKKRSSASPQPGPSSKRRKSGYSVMKDVRVGNLGGHWPIFVEKRGRCEYCSMQKIESKPKSVCSLCKVHLCCNEKKDCFVKYHDVAV